MDRTGDTNVGATKEAGSPSTPQTTAVRRSGYRWTAPASGPVTIETAGSAFDTLLAVYTGTSLGALDLILENDDASGTIRTSRLTFPASAGTTYRIAVDGFNNGRGAAGGAVTLRLGLGAAQR